MGKLIFLPQSTRKKTWLCRALVILDIFDKNPNISLKKLDKIIGVKSKRFSKKEMERIARIILTD